MSQRQGRACAPRVLIVTTPNREYNLNMMVRCCFPPGKCQGRAGGNAVGEKRRKEMVDDRELCSNCSLFCSGVRPAIHEYTKRTPDHRFEWTRSEFKEWATALGGKFGYDVRFDGVCGGPFDEAHKAADVFHGPGPMSQVAMFTVTCACGRTPPLSVKNHTSGGREQRSSGSCEVGRWRSSARGVGVAERGGGGRGADRRSGGQR